MKWCTNADDAHEHMLTTLEEAKATSYKRALRSNIARQFIASLLPSFKAQAGDLMDKATLLKEAIAIKDSLIYRPSHITGGGPGSHRPWQRE